MANVTALKTTTSSATKTASKVIELKATVTTGKAAKEAQASKAQANEAITVQCLGNAMTHEQIETKALDTVKTLLNWAIYLPPRKHTLRLSVGALMVAPKNSI